MQSNYFKIFLLIIRGKVKTIFERLMWTKVDIIP